MLAIAIDLDKLSPKFRLSSNVHLMPLLNCLKMPLQLFAFTILIACALILFVLELLPSLMAFVKKLLIDFVYLNTFIDFLLKMSRKILNPFMMFKGRMLNVFSEYNPPSTCIIQNSF